MSNDNKARVSTKNALTEKVVWWELEARGRVQRVGYRDFVKGTASKLGLTGGVWNDEDDEDVVHIVAQGAETGLVEFVKAISGAHGFADATDVRKVSEHGPDPALDKFRIKRAEDKLAELVDRGEQSVLILGQMYEMGKETLSAVREGDRVIGEKMDKGFSELGTKMDTGFTSLGAKMDHLGDKMDKGFRDSIASSERLHKDFTVRFDRVDASYGMIGKTLARMDKNLEKLTKAILALAQESHRAAHSAPTKARTASRSRGRKHALR